MTVPPSAATAERSNTSADASFTSPSPSRTASTRDGSPSFLPTEVAATASVGLITAPRASAAGQPMSGISAWKNHPVPMVVTRTRTTARALIGLKLRRKSWAGMFTAAEYSSGRTPARISSGSISRSGTPGMKLIPTPRMTRSRGAATPSLPENNAMATMAMMPTTPTRVSSMLATSPSRPA